MKTNTKSSITLPRRELALVKRLRARLHATSNVEIVRRGLQLLAVQTDRDQLRQLFRDASAKVRPKMDDELADLDHLADESLDL
jgi:mRNA interferase MazF